MLGIENCFKNRQKFRKRNEIKIRSVVVVYAECMCAFAEPTIFQYDDFSWFQKPQQQQQRKNSGKTEICRARVADRNGSAVAGTCTDENVTTIELYLNRCCRRVHNLCVQSRACTKLNWWMRAHTTQFQRHKQHKLRQIEQLNWELCRAVCFESSFGITTHTYTYTHAENSTK